MNAMHEVDYKIFGEDLQYVEVELDPQEAVVAEAGGMMYMEDGIEMETIFGDGSAQQQGGGFMGALMGAGKRLLTGESLFMTVFQNRAAGKRRVAFGAPYPGRIVPVHLAELGGELIVQKDAFLAAAKGVSIGIAFQKKLGIGLFGGEGFIMQRLQGDGWAFIHAGGMLMERQLGARREPARRHRLHRRLPALGGLRHPDGERRQVGDLRRRGALLRDAHGAREDLAPVVAALADGEPDRRRRAGRRARRARGGLGPRRPRQHFRGRQVARVIREALMRPGGGAALATCERSEWGVCGVHEPASARAARLPCHERIMALPTDSGRT